MDLNHCIINDKLKEFSLLFIPNLRNVKSPKTKFLYNGYMKPKHWRNHKKSQNLNIVRFENIG